MRLKPGVSLLGMQPQLIVAWLAAFVVYSRYGVEPVITSVCDGKHSITSLHYAGCAMDIRTRDFGTEDDARQAAAEINDRLGKDFDVLFEDDHIHIEYQPRR